MYRVKIFDPLTTVKKVISTVIPPKMLGCIALFGCLAGNVNGFEALDKTVAVVEQQVILESELEQRLRHLQAREQQLEVNDKLRRQVLDQLILEELQLAVARRINLDVADAEVDEQLRQLQRRLNGEEETLSEYLQQRQQTEASLRAAIRKDITLKKLQQGTINSRLRITEREIDEFLQSKAGQEWLIPRFRLSHILLPLEPDGEAAAMAQARQILRELQKPGSEFAKIAQRVSKGPNASSGGDLGWRTKDQLPALFYDAVVNLDSGDLSPLLRSGAGIHILQVTQRSGAKPVMVERYKTRHILIKPTELFTDAEAKAKIDAIYAQLVAGADFVETARELTEDSSSKSSGGDLGWSVPGRFVPEFEQAMINTPVGAISKPFRSPFGWHVLKVEESKMEDMFETVKRNQVVAILRQRRFDDELQLWLQELRENAYVEVLI